MNRYLAYWVRMVRFAFTGGRGHKLWILFLLAGVVTGLVGYTEHLRHGLGITNMTDQVPWGIGIANFVYFVGAAASAALIIIPAYAYEREDMKDLSIVVQLFAAVSVVMCMLWITTDVGRPDRLWHMIPGIGRLNFPTSLLAWDVVVFSGYLALSLHVPGYLLYKRYLGETPNPRVYRPLAYIAMGWAVGLHTVTAFLLSGLGGRAFWHTAVLAPRFLITTCASGPAMLILLFAVLRRNTGIPIRRSVFDYLKTILRFALPANLFLVGCEFFTDFYAGGSHTAGAQYLFFGLNGHNHMPKFIWLALAGELVATVIFVSRRLRVQDDLVFMGSMLTIVGIWIEKGIALIFPGFLPTSLGEIVDYMPNADELIVSGGVLSLGLLALTLVLKVAIAILNGELREDRASDPAPAPDSTSARVPQALHV